MILVGQTQSEVDIQKANKEKEAKIREYQDYLDSTDWYVTRFMERNIAIPEEVSINRLDAVNKINELRS